MIAAFSNSQRVSKPPVGPGSDTQACHPRLLVAGRGNSLVAFVRVLQF
jgi:hypothetical protein